jgi:hypothetical protein
MCRPAWRIIQTGTRSTFSPRAARNKRGSRLSLSAIIAIRREGDDRRATNIMPPYQRIYKQNNMFIVLVIRRMQIFGLTKSTKKLADYLGEQSQPR